jgi:predicted Zn finger-like uncharacterized protein
MATRVTCPNCSAALKLANAPPAGKRIRCPKCSEPFLPEIEEDSSAAGEAVQAAQKPAAKPTAEIPARKPTPKPAVAKQLDDGDDEELQPAKAKRDPLEEDDEIQERRPKKKKKRQSSSPLVLILGGVCGLIFLVAVLIASLYFSGVFDSKKDAAQRPPEPKGPPDFKGPPDGKGPDGKGPDFKGPPDFKGGKPPNFSKEDWQERSLEQAKCRLLLPNDPIPAQDPDNKGRTSFAAPSPNIAVLLTVFPVPDDQKGKDPKAYLNAYTLDGLKTSKSLEQGGYPAIELVPQDAGKADERITRVVVAEDRVYQIDVMRTQQPLNRGKAEEIFKSFKALK